MKTNLLRIYLVTVFLLSDFILFAQPGEESDAGNLQDDDAPQAPINGKLIWLLVAGLLFAIYTFRRRKQQA
ncbi:MAG: hypothetical protein EOO51_09460 [Flavobacterium sp.]|nr:MAG: hypothetical protein EOO51_09460 [Flavobacterium sp.]